MSALSNSKIPIPKMYGYCCDMNIIGSEFYIMEFLNGAHEFDPDLPNYTKNKEIKFINIKLKFWQN